MREYERRSCDSGIVAGWINAARLEGDTLVNIAFRSGVTQRALRRIANRHTEMTASSVADRIADATGHQLWEAEW